MKTREILKWLFVEKSNTKFDTLAIAVATYFLFTGQYVVWISIIVVMALLSAIVTTAVEG